MAVISKPAGLEDLPMDVSHYLLADFTAMELRLFGGVSRRCNVVSREMLRRRVARYTAVFFGEYDIDRFQRIFARTGAIIYGSVATKVVYPEFMAPSIRIAVHRGGATPWLQYFKVAGWKQGVKRTVCAETKEDSSMRVYSFHKKEDPFRKPERHRLHTRGCISMTLTVTDSPNLLPVVFNSRFTDELVFFDHSRLYCFHPLLLQLGWTLNRHNYAALRHADRQYRRLCGLDTAEDLGTFHLPCGEMCKVLSYDIKGFKNHIFQTAWNPGAVGRSEVEPYLKKLVWRNGERCKNPNCSVGQGRLCTFV